MLIATLLAATMLTYSSERCGFSFEYRSTWIAVENPAAQVRDPKKYPRLADCAVGLRPKRWRNELREAGFEMDRYPVRVIKWNKGFIKAAADSFFFRHDDGVWRIISRGTEPEADEFRTACCQGLIGTSWSRIWSKTEEIGSLSWQGALVNDRKGHSVVIESDHSGEFAPVVVEIIHSIRFRSAARTP